MASFSGISFRERGQGNGQGYAVWSKGGVVVVKHIPGGDKNVIQKLGVTLPRVAIVARMTGAQLSSMYAAKGTSATLVFHFESVTATLESVENVEQIFNGDNYRATLNFIRSSAAFTIPITSILLEDGSALLLEDGTAFLLE